MHRVAWVYAMAVPQFVRSDGAMPRRRWTSNALSTNPPFTNLMPLRGDTCWPCVGETTTHRTPLAFCWVSAQVAASVMLAFRSRAIVCALEEGLIALTVSGPR